MIVLKFPVIITLLWSVSVITEVKTHGVICPLCGCGALHFDIRGDCCNPCDKTATHEISKVPEQSSCQCNPAMPRCPITDKSSIIEHIGTYNLMDHRENLKNIDVDAVSNNPENANCPYTPLDAVNLIDGIKRATQFYIDSFHLMNGKSDFGFGLDILKGQLKRTLSNKHQQLDGSLKMLLQDILMTAEKFSKTIYQISRSHQTAPVLIHGTAILKNGSEIWERNELPWKSNQIIIRYNFTNIGSEKESFDAFMNYQCLVSLVTNCHVPIQCRETHLTKIYTQYRLTHQALLLHFANQKSCVGESSKGFPLVDSEQFQDKICSKIYQEAELLANNNFPVLLRHLFVQQSAYCGLLGYPNFFRSDWLNSILSWQSKGDQGCIVDFYSNFKTTEQIINIQNRINGEKVNEDCTVRMTWMTLSALSMHLRYMFDNCDFINELKL